MDPIRSIDQSNWFPTNEWEILDWARHAAARLTERFSDWLVPLVREDRPAVELAHLYVICRAICDAFDGPMDLLKEQVDKLGGGFLPDAFERDKAKTLTITAPDANYRVTVQVALRASIRKDHRDAAYDWLRSNGLGDLITSTVNASTLSAAGRKMVEEGREFPEDHFNSFYQNTTSVTKVVK